MQGNLGGLDSIDSESNITLTMLEKINNPQVNLFQTYLLVKHDKRSGIKFWGISLNLINMNKDCIFINYECVMKT